MYSAIEEKLKQCRDIHSYFYFYLFYFIRLEINQSNKKISLTTILKPPSVLPYFRVYLKMF